MRLKVKNTGWEHQMMTPSTTHNPTEKVGLSVILGLGGARPRLDRAEPGRDGSLESGCGCISLAAWSHPLA